MEFKLKIQFKIAITAIIQITGNLNYMSIRMSIKLDGTLFKFETCLYKTLRAFEFFKPKIKKFPRLTEVAAKLLCILSSPAVFQGVFNVRSTEKKQLKMSTLKDRLSLFGTYV